MATDYAKEWGDKASSLLLGKRITKVSYLTKKEAEQLGWDHRTVVLEVEGGISLWSSRDDEGNDAGAIFTTNDDLPTIPVIPL